MSWNLDTDPPRKVGWWTRIAITTCIVLFTSGVAFFLWAITLVFA